MESQMYQQLRKLINVVDELRDLGLQQFINLPRICVLGTQSAGKSSVLESIVGLELLPRGDGVVTRRPLELRLVHLSETEHKIDVAWAVFETDKTKKYTNFEEVRAEIDRLTDQVAGKNKGIIDDPIVLTVYATACPDLSLIDLPGITRVPLRDSDQTDDIEKLTRQMAIRYAQDPRTIILAVIPANADISTSDALQLARRVDPMGVRTIGVITKIDLMDRGTDATKMLTGEDIPLRLGYTGVRNRSQADIREGRSIKDALEEEKNYFQSHAAYRALPSHMVGIPSLIDKLTKVLFRHIKHFLPEIRREINIRSRGVQDRLDELGTGVPQENAERAQLLWTAITDYVEIFKNTIRGKYDKRLQLYFEHKDISGGAQIRTIFNELLDEFVDRKITDDMTDYEIDQAIRLHEGDSLPGFPSPDTFEYLILPHLKKIHTPVMDCLDRVSQHLENLSQKVGIRVFCRFPSLSDRVVELSQEILIRERDSTKTILQNYVDSETGYLFTNDVKYLTDHGSMISNEKDPETKGNNMQNTKQFFDADGRPIQVGPDGKPILQNTHSERAQQMFNQVHQQVSGLWATGRDKKRTVYSEQFIREIRRRLDSYFSLVLRNIRDSVPKMIGYFLVRQLQEKLQFELYNALNDEKQFGVLLGEPANITEERNVLQTQMKTLKSAVTVLQRDPSITALNLEQIDETFDQDLRELQRSATLAAEREIRQHAPSRDAHEQKGGQHHRHHHQHSAPPQRVAPPISQQGMTTSSTPNSTSTADSGGLSPANGSPQNPFPAQAINAGKNALSSLLGPSSSNENMAAVDKSMIKRAPKSNPLFDE